MTSGAGKFSDIFQRHGVSELIENMHGSVETMYAGDVKIPISFSDSSNEHNQYFVSPTSAYVDYPLDGIRKSLAQKPTLKLKFMSAMLKCARPVLRRSGLDHQVQINNWMFSTCPAPRLSEAQIRALLTRLTHEHPQRSIVMRSLNEVRDAELLNSLRTCGFTLLPARQIFLQALQVGQKIPGNLKKDRAFTKKSNLCIKLGSEFGDQDFQRAKALYDALYIEKYSTENPQYTVAFLQEMSAAGILDIIGLTTPEGTLVAWVGNICLNGTLCTPMGGYDVTLPREMGLYRMMSWLSNSRAIERNLPLNMSSGAARFKQLRGGVPALEYTAVYLKHLPFPKRAIVGLFARVLGQFAQTGKSPKHSQAPKN